MWMTRMRRGAARPALLVLGLALAAGACISSTPPPAEVDTPVIAPVTTAPEVPLEPVDAATIALVEDYWEARDTAWAAGVEAGLAFSVANNHPLLNYTADDCREAWFGGDAPIGFAERNALDSASIVSDPDFMMTVGPLAGRELGEGLLEMIVAFAYEGQGLSVADRVANVHLQVIDGTVRHFLVCEPVEITVAESSPGGTAADGGTTPGGSTTGGTTVDGITGDPVTVLPPITAVPVPVTSPGIDGGDGGGDGGDGGDDEPSGPNPPGSRPPGTGIDFCDSGDPGAQPVAGDYYLCPDDDVDPTATEDPAPSSSEDITRG